MTHTIRKLAAALVLALLAPLAFAQGAFAPAMFTPFKKGGATGSIGSGTSLTSCTSSILYADASSLLKCDPAAVVNGSVSTAGRSILTIRDTISGSSTTSNFLNITGAFPGTLSAATYAVNVDTTLDNDNQNQRGVQSTLNGTAGTLWSYAIAGTNAAAGTSGGGVYGTNTGTQTVRIGGQFTLGGVNTSGGSSALTASNGSVAADIFRAEDNGTAVFTIADGGNITIGTSNTISDANGRSITSTGFFAQSGNALALGNNGTASAYVPSSTLALTSATMNASVPTYRTQTSSFAWTNAMVTALGASLTGDINAATLPAKTRVESALIVIDTAAGGVTTLTVSCGDAIGGTPFTNYILPSDAKAAANTVYGDSISGSETGASLFDATTKWRHNYVPSYTATTLVTCHFISTGTNLNTVTTSTGRLILTTTLLP